MDSEVKIELDEQQCFGRQRFPVTKHSSPHPIPPHTASLPGAVMVVQLDGEEQWFRIRPEFESPLRHLHDPQGGSFNPSCPQLPHW